MCYYAGMEPNDVAKQAGEWMVTGVRVLLCAYIVYVVALTLWEWL